FDLYVLHDAPWRQRVQKFFDGIPAEIFVNPPAQVEQYFEEEGREGRPITAHMISTGFVVLDTRGEVRRLQDRARQLLNQPPDTSEIQRTSQRYIAALLYEDAVDIADSRPENASLILGVAVDAMLRYAFIAAGRTLPRHKEMLRTLEDLDPALAALAYAYFRATTTPERIDLAGQIADLTLGVRGFFEWETPPGS
ncbi:MAG: hypothetical protein K8J31_26550, partial [Anaerolineae bacterium]|nr:hypothetical protein [Anaerolineae bacterium]